jgi:hypothetical protein
MREPKSRLARVVEGARVPRAELWVWQREVDGDVMAARLVRFAFKALAGAGRLHGRQLSSPYDVEIRFPACVGGLAQVVRVEIRFPACVGGLAQVVRLGPRTSRSRTCRVRRKLVVRGGDLSCEAETCRRCSRSAKD